jgi:hypothetical protein
MMFRMRRIVRTISRAAALAAALALAGCGTSSIWDNANSISDKFSDAMHDFNPFGTSKKPLPGDRRAVFPEGVPGVQQGVPRELMRGSQAGDAPIEPAVEAPPPAPRSAVKKTAKTRTQVRGAQPSEAESSEPAEEEVWPPPPRR